MLKPYLMDRADADAAPYGYTPFGDVYIHLSQMAEANDLDYSHLWRIFHGKRQPSLQYARDIANALDMELRDFLDVFDRLKKTLN